MYIVGVYSMVFFFFSLFIELFAYMTTYASFLFRESIFTSFHDMLNSRFSVSVRNKFYTLVALGIRIFYLKLLLFFFGSYGSDDANVVYRIYLNIVVRNETPNLIYFFYHSSFITITIQFIWKKADIDVYSRNKYKFIHRDTGKHLRI